MWYRMMTIAFLANGLGAFGPRVLQDMGLADTHSFLYLAFWYLAGLAVSVLVFCGRSEKSSEPGRTVGSAGALLKQSAGSGTQAGLTVSPVAGFTRSELLIGGLMGICSSVGWFFLTRAISFGMLGYLAYPIAIGGNLSIVAVVGVLIFKERLSPYGYLGMASGIAGIALLATV